MRSRIFLVALPALAALGIELVFGLLYSFLTLPLLSRFFDSQDEQLSQQSRVPKAILIREVMDAVAEVCVDRVERDILRVGAEEFEDFIDLCCRCWPISVFLNPALELICGERTLHFFDQLVDGLLDSAPIVGSRRQSISMRLDDPSIVIKVFDAIPVKFSNNFFGFLNFLAWPCCCFGYDQNVAIIFIFYFNKKVIIEGCANRAVIGQMKHPVLEYLMVSTTGHGEANLFTCVGVYKCLEIKNCVIFAIVAMGLYWRKYGFYIFESIKLRFIYAEICCDVYVKFLIGGMAFKVFFDELFECVNTVGISLGSHNGFPFFAAIGFPRSSGLISLIYCETAIKGNRAIAWGGGGR